MSTSIIAGAIFTPEEFALLIAAFVAVCIAFAVGVALFIRSSWRLATHETKAPFDIAVVIIGLVLILIPTTGAGVAALQERSMERHVRQVLDPISDLPDDAFTVIHPESRFELNNNDCDVTVAQLTRSLEVDRRELAEQEAAAFTEAGWEVTRYDVPTEAIGKNYLSFRADGPDDTSVSFGPDEWGHLRYRITDHSCADTEFIVDGQTS